jgi:hypothetical protein
MSDTRRLGIRTIAPGQREPLSHQDIAEVPAADIDPRQGPPVAVLAMALDNERSGPDKFRETLLGPEAGDQLAMAMAAARSVQAYETGR